MCAISSIFGGSSKQTLSAILLYLAVLVAGLYLAGCSSDKPKMQSPDATALTSAPTTQASDNDPYGNAAHARLFAASRFPSATACGQCHPTQYRQWSVSQHAYAQLSPIFNAMQANITAGTNGTNGDFCIRCHTQVGMNIGEST